ncbi:uncharacterized protein LOC107046651 [Diachasma alloeum]|uniref:uncharacterized protein LOC107046651 n=1 Tax=Diachasma alloeum TaxID=454923 RepID=UPI0007384E0B|nr:uncharacterized protein LOC107046651 [Diachasma alloeum]
MCYLYAECEYNAAGARRLYAERYPGRRLPAVSTIAGAARRFDETGNALPNHREAGPQMVARNPATELRVLRFFRNIKSFLERTEVNKRGIVITSDDSVKNSPTHSERPEVEFPVGIEDNLRMEQNSPPQCPTPAENSQESHSVESSSEIQTESHQSQSPTSLKVVAASSSTNTSHEMDYPLTGTAGEVESSQISASTVTCADVQQEADRSETTTESIPGTTSSGMKRKIIHEPILPSCDAFSSILREITSPSSSGSQNSPIPKKIERRSLPPPKMLVMDLSPSTFSCENTPAKDSHSRGDVLEEHIPIQQPTPTKLLHTCQVSSPGSSNETAVDLEPRINGVDDDQTTSEGFSARKTPVQIESDEHSIIDLGDSDVDDGPMTTADDHKRLSVKTESRANDTIDIFDGDTDDGLSIIEEYPAPLNIRIEARESNHAENRTGTKQSAVKTAPETHVKQDVENIATNNNADRAYGMNQMVRGGNYAVGDEDDDDDDDDDIGDWRSGGRNRTELYPRTGVFIWESELDRIKVKFGANPDKMIRELIRKTIGRKNMINMTRTGKGPNRVALPDKVYRAVRKFVNQRIPDVHLSTHAFNEALKKIFNRSRSTDKNPIISICQS